MVRAQKCALFVWLLGQERKVWAIWRTVWYRQSPWWMAQCCTPTNSKARVIWQAKPQVITWWKGGLVVKLQRMFLNKGYGKPQFMSCQHRVLNRILCVMNEELTDASNSSTIKHFFLSKNWQVMKNSKAPSRTELMLLKIKLAGEMIWSFCTT